MTPGTSAVLKELRGNTEGCYEQLPDGREWRTVYLDNAVPAGMAPRAFAGHLSDLERLGFYKPHGDGCFGDVLCEAD